MDQGVTVWLTVSHHGEIDFSFLFLSFLLCSIKFYFILLWVLEVARTEGDTKGQRDGWDSNAWCGRHKEQVKRKLKKKPSEASSTCKAACQWSGDSSGLAEWFSGLAGPASSILPRWGTLLGQEAESGRSLRRDWQDCCSPPPPTFLRQREKKQLFLWIGIEFSTGGRLISFTQEVSVTNKDLTKLIRLNSNYRVSSLFNYLPNWCFLINFLIKMY